MSKLSRTQTLVIMAILFLLLVQIAVVIAGVSKGLQGRADFRTLYAGGYLVRTGHGDQLYDYDKTSAAESKFAGGLGANLPFNHPAFEAALFAALSILSYKKAYCLFFVLNLGLLALAFRFLKLEESASVKWGVPAEALAMAGFLPVGICLIHGQDSILFFCIVAGCYALQKIGKEFAAGLVLGLGLFRFQLVIPLVLCLCFARKWKLLAGVAATGAVVAGISIAITEPAPWMTYPRCLMAMNPGLQTESQRFANAIRPLDMPNLRGLVQLLFGAMISPEELKILTMVASAALVVWAIVKRLRFELLIVVAVLVSYHGLIHDSVLLLLPLLRCGIPSTLEIGKRLAAWMLLICPTIAFATFVPYAALAVVYLAFLIVIARPETKQAAFT
jgi:hypothetical protein